MADYHYKIVQHDGGWAYTLNGTFSEPFANRLIALAAARLAVAEQSSPGETTDIEYQDEAGVWHHELARGGDRPDIDVTA
jgi:hypothetical protein